MARGPDIRMMPGADLVVHLEHVEVLLGAQIEHPQIADGHQAHKVVSSVVGGNDESRRSVSLPKGACECGPGVTGAEGTRSRIEAVAGFGKARPAPRGGWSRLDSPDLAAGWNRSTAYADGPVIRERDQIAGRRLRHRGTSASATRVRRSWVCAALP